MPHPLERDAYPTVFGFRRGWANLWAVTVHFSALRREQRLPCSELRIEAHFSECCDALELSEQIVVAIEPGFSTVLAVVSLLLPVLAAVIPGAHPA